METLKINYLQLFQIFQYFKSFENIFDFTFSLKRKILRFNETLEKEYLFLQNEAIKIADKYCEKDQNGKFVLTEDGKGRKLKEDQINKANEELLELYKTEIEIQWQPFKLPEKYFDNLKCDISTIKFIEDNFLEE